ncbi:HDOD domain-containing protein [Ideonella sp.]|uniref:HDOD domain-containing protein n=1 Tax=Ideonella sp. TaxID=1929293 RepID=UPI003BB6F5DC
MSLHPIDNRCDGSSQEAEQSLLRTVQGLAPLPQAVQEVLQLLHNDQLSADRCVHLIEQDQALAARTLRLANSAFYGVPGRVSRISDAVNLLGLRTLSGVLGTAALTQALPPERCAHFNYSVYWRHAIGSALAARLLAPQAGQDPEQAFLAGLMHDFGQLVLAMHCPARADAALALAQSEGLRLEDAEMQTMGTDHARVGEMLAKHWHFPSEIANAIAQHHRPELGLPAQGLHLAGLVHLSHALAHGLDANPDQDGVGLLLEHELCARRINLQALEVRDLLAHMARSIQEICVALHLP